MELWKKYLVILAMAIILILGIILGRALFPRTDVQRVLVTAEHRDTVMTRDTVYRPKKVIAFRDTGSIVYMRDTIIESKPFVASLPDSLYDGDTLNVDYYFPNNMFEVLLRRRAEKVETITRYITIIKEVEKPEAWYVKPAIGGGGVALGYALKSIFK